MDVAISGDRGSCLTAELGLGTYLFAVAHGFGHVEGQPIAPAVLGRLRSEFERYTRGDRLRRSQRRSRGIPTLLTSAFERVNDEVHARTASHEDYVTAGCSLTGVVMLDDRAYLAHVGSTAAYLSRDGYVVSLTKNDAFESDGLPVLTRAVGVAPTVEVAVCSFSLNEGDALVLSGRRLREADERRRVAECVSGAHSATANEQLLVVRYTPNETAQVNVPVKTHHFSPVYTGVLATIFFYALLCLH
jgi:serine/threonine protein phosphatase PrpC